MPLAYHRCLDCSATTAVRTWPATREDPADSTWGDGCEHCGGELDTEPLDESPEDERDWEMELDR